VAGRNDVPSSTNFTPDGETLYYRVGKILKVLDDTLAARIPDLQDLKEANGESGGKGSPAKTADAPPVTPPSSSTTGTQSLASGSASQQSETTLVIPPQLIPRNQRLKQAFPTSNDVARTEVESAHLFVPGGALPREYLAQSILAKADLPSLQNESSLASLTFYRKHATDDATTTRLENAYRIFALIPAAK
jgi:hypothetical protein